MTYVRLTVTSREAWAYLCELPQSIDGRYDPASRRGEVRFANWRAACAALAETLARFGEPL